MKFSIITPTYKRAEKLKRAIESLQKQTYTDWEMIIVNDSSTDETYKPLTSSIKDARIRYYVNSANRGANFTRNYALDKLSKDSQWVIFLDDDDYLAPGALKNFSELILLHQDTKWFLTNRALKNGTSLTKFPTNETAYDYAWSYLILKKGKGDATHCIETKLIRRLHARFSHYVKQGEEWFFFYQIGRTSKLYYQDHNSTISDGYDVEAGLNFRKRTLSERFETITKLVHEGGEKRILYTLPFVTYIILRYISLLRPSYWR